MDQLTKEAVRYLGYGKHAVDMQTRTMIADAFESLRVVAGRKCVYRIFCLEQADEAGVCFGGLRVESRSLGKNLKGCDRVVLFGATLGTETDMLIRRASLTDMAQAVVLQACAAALLEEYCDECQEKIAGELEREGRYVRPRFSPGYGDFSIEYQAEIMQMLDCAKKIGLTMTSGFMMTPTKSVTALIGAGTTKENCHRKGCHACGKADCLYRMRDDFRLNDGGQGEQDE